MDAASEALRGEDHMTVTFGVAGTGWVAGEYLKWIEHHPQGRVAGIASRNLERARSWLHSRHIDAKVYGSFQEMVEDANIDAVVLCSTPDIRPQHAILAAQYNKHVILEKPLALDFKSLHEMAEAFEKCDVRTAAGFVLRWNPLFDTIKSLTDKGALGHLLMASVDYWHHIHEDIWSAKHLLGRSSTLSAGCHAVDALRYFAGDVEEVTAVSCKHVESKYEYDPNILAVLKMKSGAMGKVSSLLQCSSPYKFNIQLHGDKGTLLDNKLYSPELFPGQIDYTEIPVILPNSGDVGHHPFHALIAEFIHAIENHLSTRCSFGDAYKSMELCFAIDESIATGKTITVSE